MLAVQGDASELVCKTFTAQREAGRDSDGLHYSLLLQAGLTAVRSHCSRPCSSQLPRVSQDGDSPITSLTFSLWRVFPISNWSLSCHSLCPTGSQTFAGLPTLHICSGRWCSDSSSAFLPPEQKAQFHQSCPSTFSSFPACVHSL